MRIGHGFDVHQFIGNRPLILGGIEVPYHFGLLAHSDGDVVLHAVADAILGAMALGDIGKWFPDNDPRYKNCDSRQLLSQVWQAVKEKHYQLGNLDITIMAQMPKMAPHVPAMRHSLAQLLTCDSDQVNVKATTTERLGFIGREEGIACEAVVLLKPVV